MIAGSYLSVNVIAGSVSAQKLSDLQTQLEATRLVLESNDQAQIAALSREEILGDMFYAGTLGYYAQLQALSHMAGLASKGHYQLAAGIGTIGYEPKVNYFFGFPRAIQPGGIAFDIPFIYNTANGDGDNEIKKQFTMQVGILSSALEHATPEQAYHDLSNSYDAPDAVSAVKALQKASIAGQRIYQITQANMATMLPNIHHDQGSMDEIIASLNAEKEVLTHSDSISVPGWSGAGYIILDPETGAGAYKIAGGGNGSSDSDPMFALGLSLAALSGAADGYADELLGDNLPFDDDWKKIQMAKRLSIASKFLGGAALFIDIYNALDGLNEPNGLYNVIGKLSIAIFGFAVGNVAVGVISATFFPLAAALIAAVFVATLAIVLADFALIYYSYIQRMLFNRYGNYVFNHRFENLLKYLRFNLDQKGDPPALLGRHYQFDSNGSLIVTPKREPPSNTQRRNHETSRKFKPHTLGV